MTSFRFFAVLFIFISNIGLCQPPGNSYLNNGGNHFIEIPHNSNLNVQSTGFTIESWIKPCDIDGLKTVASKQWCNNANFGYYFGVRNGEITWAWLQNGDCAAGITVVNSINPLITVNNWAHIAAVVTPTTVDLYHNGQLVSSYFYLGSNYSTVYSSTQPFRIGTYRGVSGLFDHFFDGQIDEVRIWNTALTQFQIASRMNTALTGNEPNLVAYYPMEHNFSGNGNTITNQAQATGTTLNGITTGAVGQYPLFIDNSLSNLNLNLGNDTTLCLKNSFNLNASSFGLTYLWSTGATTPSISINSGGTYSVTTTIGNCISSDSINIINDSLLCGDTTNWSCFKPNYLMEFNGDGELTSVSGANYGMGITPLGDLNNDGYTDIAISGYRYGVGGAVFIHFLDSMGEIMSTTTLSSGINGLPTFANDSRFGTSLDTLGDFDNDGNVDLVVGAMYAYEIGFKQGAVYILFLNSDGTVKSYNKIDSNNPLFASEIIDETEFGRSVINLGDVNNDGIKDIGVGAWYADDSLINSGSTYIVYLNSTGFPQSFFKIANSTPGFNHVLETGCYFGFALARLNDIDKNGTRDLAITSIYDYHQGSPKGAFYICLLDNPSTLKQVKKYSNHQNNLPFTINQLDYFGDGIYFAGDIDNNGTNELFVSSTFNDDDGPNSGSIYQLSLDNNLDITSFVKHSRANPIFQPYSNPDDRFGFGIRYSEFFSPKIRNVLFVTMPGSELEGTNNGFAIGLGMIDTCRFKCLPTEVSRFDTICENENYQLPSGKIVNNGGTYSDTLPTSSGCDSIFNFQIIERQNHFYLTDSVCNNSTYKLPSGKIVTQPGVYYDTLRSIKNCDSIYELRLGFVSDTEPIDFSHNLNIGCNGLHLILENENPNALNFYFEIDGEKYRESPLNLEFPLSKEILVRAYSGLESCQTTDSLVLSKKAFEEHLNLTFPNVFTPNKDGLNETFGFNLNSELNGCVDFIIYNRWGRKVFETSAINVSWDGKGLNGNECQAGVYVYILKIENYQVLGSVTLLR